MTSEPKGASSRTEPPIGLVCATLFVPAIATTRSTVGLTNPPGATDTCGLRGQNWNGSGASGRQVRPQVRGQLVVDPLISSTSERGKRPVPAPSSSKLKRTKVTAS